MSLPSAALTFVFSYKTVYRANWRTYFPVVLFFTISLLWIAAAYKYGDWKNYRIYYPTILFFWCGNLIYNVVFHDTLLWKFENPFYSHIIIDFYNTVTVSTSTVLIFLSRFPKKLREQVLYTILWISLYSAIEFFFTSFNSIVYSSGWSIWWSIIHNIYQFLLLKLHHHKPIFAWILAIAILIVIMNIFQVSISI